MFTGVFTCSSLRAVSAVAIALIAGASSAQFSQAVRYPWDNRPDRCLTLVDATAGECVADHWPTYLETERRVIFLYSTEQFRLLERALAELSGSKKRFLDGESPASAASRAFGRMMPAPGTDPRHKDRIARWRSAVPDSIFVPFAEARALYGEAWNIRGTGYSESVSKESWALYAERLQQAERVLLAAPKALKESPLWHGLLLAISLDSDRVQSNPQVVFAAAVKAWPDYYGFYEVMLTRLQPAWGGSWEKVDAFIDHWSRERSSREGSSLYARLYVSVSFGPIGAMAGETKLKWAKMKPAFVDLLARYPDPFFKNTYASYACFARDKQAFSDAMRAISSDVLNPQHWLSGHSYDACVRWAST